MRHGEVWWADLPTRASRRPIVLPSRDAAYRVRTSVIIVPVTCTIRNIPVEVPLDSEDGLPTRCVANLDDITTIEKSFLQQRITVLSAEKMQQVEEGIRFALDLP